MLVKCCPQINFKNTGFTEKDVKREMNYKKSSLTIITTGEGCL